MVFFIPMFWGALAVAAGCHVAMEVGALFPSLLLPRLWAQPDLGPPFVHLPGWKVFCCKELVSVQGSVKGVRGYE